MGKYPVIFCDFKVRVSSKLFRQLVYAKQNLTGESWEAMLSKFRDFVSALYAKWQDCLTESLRPWHRKYFESILDKTATLSDLKRSLYKLSYFLAEKFGRKVIVLIDGYEGPTNRANDHGYFDDVRYPYLSLTIGVKDKYSRPTGFSGSVHFLFS
jgi:hypothetical protein